MPVSSNYVNVPAVYSQDARPSNDRAGIIWVDTSITPPATKVSDGDTFNLVASGSVTVQDAEPTGKDDGHLWIDTSGSTPRPKVLDGGTWVGIPTPEAPLSATETGSFMIAKGSGYQTTTVTLSNAYVAETVSAAASAVDDAGVSGNIDAAVKSLSTDGNGDVDGIEIQHNHWEGTEPADGSPCYWTLNGMLA